MGENQPEKRTSPAPSDRFVIERSVASGGMGVVYLARDQRTSERVALKILHVGLEDDARFEREAVLLSGLSHPAIVRYVAHGRGADGRPFLAMEWLEGEDLGKRLSRGPLALAEALALVQRVAEGLAIVHRAGLIHRDIKPDNLFLAGGALDQAKIVDFGLARPPRAGILTAEGVVLGTPGYMAPEQIRGELPDARVDVFALGCVLYQCLTGKAPFAGGGAVAVLTRVLIEEPPPISKLRPEVPLELCELTARLMSKKRLARPADGQAVIAELATLGAGSRKRGRHLSGAERVLAAVLVVAWFQSRFDHYEGTIQTIAAQHGARVEASLGHGAVIGFPRTHSAEEQAIAATRAALEMARLPGLRASLALAATEGSLSEAIERVGTPPLGWPRGSVLVDDNTERLLPSRFERVAVGLRCAIVAEREGLDLPRSVLGKTTPFVGRHVELGGLVARTEHLFGSSRSGVLVISGEPGSGKSRLRFEAMRAIGKRASALSVLAVRGDPTARSAPLGVIREMLRRVCGVIGDDLALDRSRLLARVSRSVSSPARAMHIARFLGEAVGVPFGDDAPTLNAARAERALLAEQVRTAIGDFIAAEAFRGPLLVIVEDAHDADAASIELLASLVERLGRSPFVVWVLTRRPLEQVAQAWSSEVAYMCRLGALAEPEVRELLTAVAGADPRIDKAAAEVAHAGASPLLVEEAARALAERPGASTDTGPLVDLPAILGARLSALPTRLRDVLRAASTAGAYFWVGLVIDLLGETDSAACDAACDELVRGEWLIEHPVSRFHGERQLAFGSEALRRAAQGLLVAADRARGHEITARYLERMGESDSRLIAEHFEAAGLHAAAVPHLLKAAERALLFSDTELTLTLANRALVGAAEAESRGALLTLLAEAERTRGNLPVAAELAERAVTELGSLGLPRPRRWFDAVGEGIILASRLRRLETMVRYSDLLLGDRSERPSGAQVIATARAAMLLEHAGVELRARPLYDYLDAVASRFQDDPLVLGRLTFARAWRQQTAGDYHAYKRELVSAIQCFETAGDAKTAGQMEANAAYACLELGDFAEAIRLARSAEARALASSSPAALALSHNNLGMALGRSGKLEEGVVAERAAVEGYRKLGDVRLEGASRVYLSRLLAWSGSFVEAEAEARTAVTLLETVPLMGSQALAAQSYALLGRGRVAEALTAAQRAYDVLARAGGCEGSPVGIHLALVDALLANGEDADAGEALRRAEAAIELAAAKISDPVARAGFVENVPEHMRVRALRRSS